MASCEWSARAAVGLFLSSLHAATSGSQQSGCRLTASENWQESKCRVRPRKSAASYRARQVAQGNKQRGLVLDRLKIVFKLHADLPPAPPTSEQVVSVDFGRSGENGDQESKTRALQQALSFAPHQQKSADKQRLALPTAAAYARSRAIIAMHFASFGV